MLHYTSFAGRTEIYSVFCISVCSSHHTPRKTCYKLWKPGALPKLREITSCSSDPQHITLLAKIKESKTWICLEICLDFQMQQELKSPSSACSLSSGPWPGTAKPTEPRAAPATPSTLTCPGKGGNLGCCWPLTPGCRRQKAAGENRKMGRIDYQPDLCSGAGSSISANSFTETTHKEITAENTSKMELASLPLNCQLYGTSCWTVWKKNQFALKHISLTS